MSADEPPLPEAMAPESDVLPEVEVSISGVGFGPFTLEKLRERVQEGLLTAADSARWANSEEWATVGDFLAVPPAEPPALFIYPPAAEPVQFEQPAEAVETNDPPRMPEPEPPPMAAPHTPSRPLTGPLIRARSAGTSSLSAAGLGATRPLAGLKSQIMARTSQEPLKPMRPLPPARPELAVTTPFKFAPITRVQKPEPLPAEIEPSVRPPFFEPPPIQPVRAEPARVELAPVETPSLESPEPQPFEPVPFETPQVKPLFITPAQVASPFESTPIEPVQIDSAPPEPVVETPPDSSAEPPENIISFAPPEQKAGPPRKNETAKIRRHALPASKTGSLPVLPVFTITAPAERGLGKTGSLASPVKTPRFILPPRPGGAARPVADADSVIAVRLPDKRHPASVAMPPPPEETESLGQSERSASTHVSLPGVAHNTSTAPLPPPARTSQVKKATSGTGVTLASVAAPPPDEVKGERPPLRRGMSTTSALAATTVMPGAGAEPPPPEPPKRTSIAKSVRSAFGPPQRLDPAGSNEEAAPAPMGSLAETRRTALKQARVRRRRQGFVFAAVGLVCFFLFCLGIYHYTSYTTETPVALSPEKKTAPSEGNPVPTHPGVAVTPSSPPPKPPPPPAPAGPSNPQVLPLIAQGQAAQAKGDYDQAVAAFSQAVDLDPKYAQTYSYRAAARMAKGDTAGAMADDNLLLALDPTNAAGFCQRGFVKQAAKDMDGALADYSRAVQLDPKSYVAFYNRALIQEKAGKADEAISDYNQTLTLNPKLAGAFFNRGNAKMDKNDMDGAVADYTSALAIDPKIALAYCNRALAEQNSGNLNAALADYNKGLAIDGKVAMAYYNRGLIEEQLDDLDGCVRDSTTAIELNPDNAQAYYNRGVALQAKGNLEAAALDLQKFTELAPKNVYADYARLYLWVVTSQQNQKTSANQQLSGVLTSTWNAEPAQLPSKIAAFLLDQISEQDLMAAVSTDPKKTPGERCEALYFDGMKQLLNGKKSAATICLNQCLDTGQRDYCEFILAQAQLQTMNP